MSFFLISQNSRNIATIEASNPEAALARAKGLAHILNFSASLPLEAQEIDDVQPDVPSFYSFYFELLGFTK